MKTLTFITLVSLFALVSCSHHHRGHCCKGKEATHCSKEKCEKKCCDKEKKCKDGSCEKKEAKKDEKKS